MHRLIPALLAATVLATSSGAQIIGPETSLAPTENVAVPSFGLSPRLAATGDGYFAAWIDGRGGVYGTRLDRRGNPRDAGGIHLGAPQMLSAYEVAVSAAGTYAMVVIAHCPYIEVLRVSTSGAATTLPSIGQNGPETCTGQIEMATNGASFLVVWDGLAEMIDRNGVVLAGPFATGITRRFVVASNGDGYLIAGFTDAGDGVVLPVRSDGVVLPVRSDETAGNHEKLIGTPFPQEFALASDGSQYVLIVAGGRSLETRILKPDGSIAKATTFGDGFPGGPRLTWNGREYLVAVHQFVDSASTQTVRLARLGVDGHPLSAFLTIDRVNYANAVSMPIDLVGTPDGALVTWVTNGPADVVVLATTISDATIDGGTAPTPIALSLSVPSQRSALLVRTDGGMAAVWREGTGNFHVVGAPLDGSGRPRAIPVGLDQAGLNPVAYKIAFDGKNIVVAWAYLSFPEGPIIAMARYTAELQPLDSQPLVVTASGSTDFDLTAGSGLALVAWSTASGIRVDLVKTGDPFLQPLPDLISEVPGKGVSNTNPALAWNGNEFLVSWWTRSVVSLVSTPDELVAVRMAADGRLIERTPLTIAKPDLPHVAFAAASNGSDFYLAWGSDSTITSDLKFVPDTIYGARVGGDGTTTGGKGTRLSPIDVRAAQPAVTGHGSDYFVAWNEVTPKRDGVPGVGISLIGNGPNPLVSTFDAPQPFSDPYSDAPSIAGSDAEAVVCYGRPASELPYNGAWRVFTRTVGGTPLRRRSITGNP